MATINIYNWADFVYYTGSTPPTYIKGTTELFSSSNDTLRFGDTNLDEHDVFIGSGRGTREDPYVCGTYYEMLCATGASNIYYLQLVENGDDENGYHLYYYPKGNKFARHDRSNTTIDFNTAQYGGVNSIYINCKINFNGWTFENLNFYPGANFRFNTQNVYIMRLILLKCSVEAISASAMGVFTTTYTGSSSANDYTISVRDSIIQVNMQHNSSTPSYTAALVYGRCTDNSFYRCTIALSGRTGAFGLSYRFTNNGATYFYDCIFNFDMNTYSITYDTDKSRAYLYACKLMGIITIRTINTSTSTLCTYANNCIIDLTFGYKDESDPTGEISSRNINSKSAGTLTVYNNDKATCDTGTTSNWHGMNSTDIKSPTALRNLGFPIGSDEINGESNV